VIEQRPRPEELVNAVGGAVGRHDRVEDKSSLPRPTPPARCSKATFPAIVQTLNPGRGCGVTGRLPGLPRYRPPDSPAPRNRFRTPTPPPLCTGAIADDQTIEQLRRLRAYTPLRAVSAAPPVILKPERRTFGFQTDTHRSVPDPRMTVPPAPFTPTEADASGDAQLVRQRIDAIGGPTLEPDRGHRKSACSIPVARSPMRHTARLGRPRSRPHTHRLPEVS